MWIVVASFIGILALFLAVYWVLVLRPEGAAERQLKRRLKGGASAAAKKAKAERLSLVNEVAPHSSVPALDRLLTRADGVRQPLEMLIERSGLQITAGHLILGTVFAAALGGVIAWWLTWEIWAAVIGLVVLGMIPYAVVRSVATRRIAKFEEQFPEAIDLISRALRAGHAFTTSLGMVAEEVAEPVRSEFKLLYDRQNYGMPLPDALRNFAERLPLLDARFFVTAVLTQRESGGNLAEVLDSLAALVRERFRLKRQVRTLSAHGRITGFVLASLPIVLSVLLYLIAPAHISRLVTDPIGVRMVMAVVVLQVIGFIAMRRIINIEI
jgi:tight adherence protein B